MLHFLHFSSSVRACLALLVALHLSSFCLAENPPVASALSRTEKEEFLAKAQIVKSKQVSTGITGTYRVTLTDGRLTHDASVQPIDEAKTTYQTARGTEFNFRDTYVHNMAAYKLDQLIGLNMIPVTVVRKFKGNNASYTWWVDDFLMMELDRHKRKMEPPDPEAWNRQMHVVRVFDQLIYNMDRNLGNLLIDKAWRLWMIDHTRSFRTFRELKTPANLVRCERKLLARLKELDDTTFSRELESFLKPEELKGLLARRDVIVRLFEQKGESALYDAPGRE
ncbi:MAG TPA: hypothetical protein VFS12_02605 [Terriglobia bacterium]|nr:hypothetical protein [Terriglobia bacterium]